MAIITRTDHDGVALLMWDEPDGPVNVKSYAAMSELSAHLDALAAEPDLRGMVIASAKKGFVAGADLRQVQAMTTEEEAARTIGWVRDILGRIDAAGKPVIAAIDGAAIGGGMELALACHGRVATHRARFQLPEVTLGLMPGAGGTQRLPRLVGLEAALPLVLEGRGVEAEAALAMGLVDELAPPEGLIAAALARARATPPAHPREAGGAPPSPAAGSAEAEALFSAAEARMRGRLGEADIAAPAILDVMRRGHALPLAEALEVEGAGFARLAVSVQAKNLIRTMFYGMNEVRRIRRRPADVPPLRIGRIAVLGAGLMGGGIALTAALRGLDVTLIDVSEEALSRGLATIDRALDRLEKRGRLSAAARAEARGRLTSQIDIGDLSGVDAVVEAVPEIPAIKADVLARASASAPAHAVIASNTSTLPITGLAGHCADPSRFIGLHFFSPVEVMALLEVVVGEQTSQTTLAHALDLAKALGKMPIVVRDGLGFYTSRVVGSYTGEALTLVAEGVEPARIDAVATRFGMPIGPVAMADVVGLVLLRDIFASLRGDGNRAVNAGSRAEEVLARLVEAGRTSRAGGGGILDYPEGRPAPWPGLAAHFPPAAQPPSDDEIRQRLFHTQALETTRAMEEGILDNATEADIGSVLGWAFPKAWGGVLSYVDTLGAARFVAECEALAARHGPRFAPTALLRQMAENGGRFHPE